LYKAGSYQNVINILTKNEISTVSELLDEILDELFPKNYDSEFKSHLENKFDLNKFLNGIGSIMNYSERGI